jgi:hypothetical protein
MSQEGALELLFAEGLVSFFAKIIIILVVLGLELRAS